MLQTHHNPIERKCICDSFEDLLFHCTLSICIALKKLMFHGRGIIQIGGTIISSPAWSALWSHIIGEERVYIQIYIYVFFIYLRFYLYGYEESTISVWIYVQILRTSCEHYRFRDNVFSGPVWVCLNYVNFANSLPPEIPHYFYIMGLRWLGERKSSAVSSIYWMAFVYIEYYCLNMEYP